jgi:hypothetical protein
MCPSGSSTCGVEPVEPSEPEETQCGVQGWPVRVPVHPRPTPTATPTPVAVDDNKPCEDFTVSVRSKECSQAYAAIHVQPCQRSARRDGFCLQIVVRLVRRAPARALMRTQGKRVTEEDGVALRADTRVSVTLPEALNVALPGHANVILTQLDTLQDPSYQVCTRGLN